MLLWGSDELRAFKREIPQKKEEPSCFIAFARQCISLAVTLHHPPEKLFDRKEEDPVVSPASKTAGSPDHSEQ